MQRTLEPWERLGAGLLQIEALLRRLGGVEPRDFAGLVIEDAEVDRLLTTFPGLDIPDDDDTAEAIERVAPRLEELRADFEASLDGQPTPFVAIVRQARLSGDEAEVLAVVRKLTHEGMTLVIATHEMGSAREVADRVLFFDEGQIVEQGPPEQVSGNPTEVRTRRFLAQVL